MLVEPKPTSEPANLPITGVVGLWVGLGPDDSLLLLEDRGTQDIYALDLE